VQGDLPDVRIDLIDETGLQASCTAPLICEQGKRVTADEHTLRELEAVLQDFESRTGQTPAVLDWDSGLELAALFPERAVFSPPAGEIQSELPYLDRTVDLVVLSHLRWDYTWQRPHHVVSRLARRFRRTWYVEEPLMRADEGVRLRCEDAGPVTRVLVDVPLAERWLTFGEPEGLDHAALLAEACGELRDPVGESRPGPRVGTARRSPRRRRLRARGPRMHDDRSKYAMVRHPRRSS